MHFIRLVLCCIFFSHFQNGTAQYNTHKRVLDNSIVEEPTVLCEQNSFALNLKTAKPFAGRIFVKGYSQDDECYMMGNNSATSLSFSPSFDHCGIRRMREVDGLSISATVIVSFHPIFITSRDKAYKVQCYYMETSKTNVSQDLEIELTTGAILQQKQTKVPQCRYEILWFNARGQPIKFAHIGENVYHRWSCQSDQTDMYCMKVHTCSVSDGQGGQTVPVLDSKGCEIDSLLLRNLEYTSDLTAGQTAAVFKFADKPSLHFNCQIELTLKHPESGCKLMHPECANDQESDEMIDSSMNQENFQSSSTAPVYTSSTDKMSKKYEKPSEEKTSSPTLSSSLKEQKHSFEYNLPPIKFHINMDQQTSSSLNKSKKIVQTEVSPATRARESGEKIVSITRRKTSDDERISNENDAMYQDETNTSKDTENSNLVEKNEVTQRRTVKRDSLKKVADFELPEQSLFVIELDDDQSSFGSINFAFLDENLVREYGEKFAGGSSRRNSLGALKLTRDFNRKCGSAIFLVTFATSGILFLLTLILITTVSVSYILKSRRVKRFSLPITHIKSSIS